MANFRKILNTLLIRAHFLTNFTFHKDDLNYDFTMSNAHLMDHIQQNTRILNYVKYKVVGKKKDPCKIILCFVDRESLLFFSEILESASLLNKNMLRMYKFCDSTKLVNTISKETKLVIFIGNPSKTLLSYCANQEIRLLSVIFDNMNFTTYNIPFTVDSVRKIAWMISYLNSI